MDMVCELIRHGIDREYDKCPSIRRLIKEIDLRFDVYFDHDKGQYIVTQTGPGGRISQWDSFSWPTREFFEHMRRVIYVNRNGDLVRETLRANDAIEQRREEKQDENLEYATREAAPYMFRALKDV